MLARAAYLRALAIGGLTVPERFPHATAELKRLGYLWVTLDLAGFRSGSLNDALSVEKKGKKHDGPEG